jgi:phage antirepressor YoqD-like protein
MRSTYNSTTFSIQNTAKLVRFPGGEKLFFDWLRKKNFLMADNMPYQKYLGYNWFLVVQKNIHKANPPFAVPVTRVTSHGLAKIEKIVFNEFHKCKCP